MNKYNFVLTLKNQIKMKKKAVLLVGLLFILIFMGCKEGVLDPDPIVPTNCTIQVNPNGPGTVIPSGAITALKGGNLTLTVTKDIGVVSKATMNDGTELPLKDGKYYVPVTSNSTVNVEFEKTPKWQLAQHPWVYFSREVRLLSTNEYLYTAYVSKGDLKYIKLTFDEDTVKGYDVSGKQVISMEYSIREDSLILGDGIKSKILKITDGELQYSAPSPFYELFPIVRRVPEKDELFIETYNKK